MEERKPAEEVDVHPGIVVGQPQFQGEIGYSHSREMLVRGRHIITQSALTDGWGHIPAGGLIGGRGRGSGGTGRKRRLGIWRRLTAI